ncbi:MAG: G5 domain-containing protein [Clostridiales bacterium]|nr:G5 domain-containing protein [Clostridiales bacterium]
MLSKSRNPKSFRMRAMFAGCLIGLGVGVTKEADAAGNTIQFICDGRATTEQTDSTTIGQFLAEKGITLDKNDLLSLPLDARLVSNETLSIDRALHITVDIDGEKRGETARPGWRVGNLAEEIAAESGHNYYYEYRPDTPIQEGDRLIFTAYKERDAEETAEIPFEKTERSDPDTPAGQRRVEQAGSPGVKTTVYRETYKFDELLSRRQISETITKQPVPQIEIVGAKQPATAVKGDFGALPSYSRVLEMRATGYSIDYQCTGKRPGDPAYGITRSGVPAKFGVVAVDPKVIPLGTRVFVEGYGQALAADTGGAIYGNRIDLCFDSLNEASNYGVKNIKVYVLKQ